MRIKEKKNEKFLLNQSYKNGKIYVYDVMRVNTHFLMEKG